MGVVTVLPMNVLLLAASGFARSAHLSAQDPVLTRLAYFWLCWGISSGELDRDRLGKVIFSDPKARGDLNGITHPVILRTIIWQVGKHAVRTCTWT
jgi:hypothetical protein